IVAIDFNDLPPARQAARRNDIIPGVERIDVPDLHLPSLLPHGPLTAATGATYDVGIKLGPNPKFGIPEGIGEEDTSSPPTPGEDLATILKKGALGGGGAGRDGKDVTLYTLGDAGLKQPPKPFDAFVDVVVTVWEDKKNGGGYFKVAITPNRESDSLRDIPKDTLIIIDHSTSIDVNKLRQFKSAAVDALSYLNRQDRFNIVGFNEKPQQLFPDFVPLDDASLASARAYIRDLYRGGMTDVFGGIAPFVQKSNRNAQRPLNIFLLTDGQSTINIYREDDFIRRIVDMNPGNVSIYPFSAGQDANRQLLDFLGYLNRGYNFHVPDLKQFKSQLLSYIGAHSSLIIRDLQYMVEGQVGNQIFPKRLPHLYRQETLEIFGRYGPQDTELVLTLAGRDAEGSVRDLVFRRQYHDCQTASEELPLQWAAKKIFHLLAQRTLTEDPQERLRLDQEIQKLGQSYNIYIPY
ncbi:MAG TPA: VWA domain-containing protein, partial [Lentisphaeria bacterium]|nr:VWA domain-containing protein [Lentisphaeria bacterium]